MFNDADNLNVHNAEFVQLLEAVITDASTSYKLRERIKQDMERDPVDALNDAEILHRLATMRCSRNLKPH